MDNNNSYAQSTARQVDAGLRAHMQTIYNRMSLGVLITAVTAWFVASSPALLQLFLGGPQAYVVMLAPLAIIWFGFRPDRMSSKQLMMAFIGLSIVYGISFSVIAVVAEVGTIARAFFVSAGMFAGLSIYGYTTKKDLSGMGTFLVMGIWGLVIASLLNIFFQSTMMQNVIAGVGIVAFSGITVWKTQELKNMYSPSYGDELNSRIAWSGALTLYISFIALFQYIMHFMNQR